MTDYEKNSQRITMEFLSAQAKRIKSNALTAEKQEEKELWAEEKKALADNLKKCYGDTVPEVNRILAELEN